MTATMLTAFLLAFGTAGTPDSIPALRYDRPATEYMSGLPIGNGIIGAMVLGAPGQERIALNHTRLWRRKHQNRPLPENGVAGLQEFRRLLFEGRVAEANRRAGELLSWQYEGVDSYQPAGDLLIRLELPGPVTRYRRQLDLSTGIVRIAYESGGVSFTLETFASRADGIISVELSASRPDALAGEVALTRREDSSCIVTPSVGAGRLLRLNGRFEEGVEFGITAQAAGPGGMELAYTGERRAGLRFSRKGRLSVPVALSVSSDSDAASERLLRSALGHQSRLRARHIEAHRRLFRRVELSLGPDPRAEVPTDQRIRQIREGGEDPGLEALYFQYGRYLLMSCSAPGGLPANLQGIWNEDLNPPWWADYHTNINLQMNYWPAEVANLSECHEPLFDWVDRAAKEGRIAAQAYYGARGTWIAQSLDAGAINRKQPGPWTEWTGAAPWLAQHFGWRWEFAQDGDFLRNRAYPLMKEAAAFFEDFLIPDPRPDSPWKGRLITAPSTSPENRYRLEGRALDVTVGATMDFALIHDLLTRAIQASEALDVDSEKRAEWRRILERIPPPQVGRHGQLQEWLEDFEEAEPGHRHVSHLFGLFPGNQITVEKTPELAAAARRSLERRLAHQGGHTGWSRAWLVCLFARLQDGSEAERHLRRLIGDFATDSLLDIHPPRIFQIDGNFGGTAGIAEMLLQSHDGVIRLLPALPESWRQGEVRGLMARGAVEVGIRWENGRALEATLLARNGGRHTVRAPRGQTIHSAAQGAARIHLNPTGRHSTEVSLELPVGKPVRLTFGGLPAESIPPKTYVCRRAESPIVVDGRLSESAWRSASWTDDFVDIEGDAREAPRFRTRAKMLWDDDYLYIGAEMQEPHVWATLTKRDSVIFHDNDFEVFIDPDGDTLNYYELEINALNTVWDLRLPKPYRDGGRAIDAWDIQGLKHAVHVRGTLNDPRDRDRGWSVELALPWKALGEFALCPAPPRPGDVWRINFSRVEWQLEPDTSGIGYRKLPDTKEDNWVWSPQGIIDMHQPERWGRVEFVSDSLPPGG